MPESEEVIPYGLLITDASVMGGGRRYRGQLGPEVWEYIVEAPGQDENPVEHSGEISNQPTLPTRTWADMGNGSDSYYPY